MTEELITGYVDRGSFKSDTDFIEGQLKKVADLFDVVNSTKITVKGATGMKGITDGVELGVKANAALAQSLKAVNTVIDQRFASEAKLATMQTDYFKQTQKNNIEIAKYTKEQKLQAAVDLAANGSREKAIALRAKLYNIQGKLNLSNKEEADRSLVLIGRIDKLNDFIKKNSDSLTKQKINIGNYEGSAKIIVDALEKEKIKLQSLTTGYRTFSEEVQKSRNVIQGFAGDSTKASAIKNIQSDIVATEKKMESLNVEMEQSRKIIEGFSRVTEQPKFLDVASKTGDAGVQLKFFTKQLIDLERNGLGSSEAANALRKSLAELTDEIGDAKAEIKALSSDTRGFDLFAGSVTFAADAMQTFAGAAVLAGASEEEAAEATKKLVAIQSVANGVKGIANELTTRGTAANKLYAFSQKQIGIAMDSTAGSAARLRAALLTVGFGAIIVGIGLLIANFQKLKVALGITSDAQEAFNSTLQNYRKGAQEAFETTNKVKEAFELAKQGVISKDEALKVYNETLGDAFGKTKSLTEAERLYNEKAETYIKIMGLKAQANALFAKSAEAAAKGVTAANEDQVGLLDKLKAGVKEFYLGAGTATLDLIDAQNKGVKKVAADAKAEADLLFAEGLKIGKQAQELSNTFDIKTDKPEKAKKDKKDNSKKEADELLKTALELEKRKNEALKALAIENANEIIRINQLIAEHENTSLPDRIAALNEVSAQRKVIAGIELADAIKSEATIQKGVRVEIEKSNEEKQVARVKFNNSIASIDSDFAKSQEDAIKRDSDRKLKIQEQNFNKVIRLIEEEGEERRAALEKQFQANTDELDRQFEQGKISQKEYNKKRVELEFEFAEEALKIEIETAKKKIAISALMPTEKAKALRELARLERQLQEASVKFYKDKEKEKLDSAIATLEKVKGVSEQVFALIDGIFEGNEIRNKNRLKEQSDAAEKKAARDIEIANASAASEEEKAAKISIINARLSAQKDAIARKEKQAEEQRARFQKSVNIFNIILSSAAAVMKQIQTTPLPFGAPFIAAVAAQGAAQLAIAIRTPIPKYFRGKRKGEPYEGPAIVNDGPKMEVIERADGSIEFPDGRNVLTHVSKDDIIHPDREAWRAAQLDAAYGIRLSHGGREKPSAISEEINRTLKKGFSSLGNTIRSKREITIQGVKGKDVMFRDGNSQTTYMNNNLQGK